MYSLTKNGNIAIQKIEQLFHGLSRNRMHIGQIPIAIKHDQEHSGNEIVAF